MQRVGHISMKMRTDIRSLADKPHIYELHVYALDKLLDLRRGFLLNELYREMDGHILAKYTLKGIYEN